MEYGLYIHVPFCVERCRYCAFPSGRYDPSLAARYLDTVKRELATEARALSGSDSVVTLYVGGGTPTVIGVEALVGLIERARSLFRVADAVEVTVEANPGTCDEEFIAALKDVGVARISVGAQSFDPDVLSWLGRIHSARDTYALADAVNEAGLALSLDLIYAVPGQTHASWGRTLEGALRLSPTHLSTYALSMDVGSRYAAEVANARQPAPDDSVAGAMYEEAVALIEAAGIPRYEVSNFAAPGRECRHNVRYWTGGAYIGVGPGAHSYDGVARRTANESDTASYIVAHERQGHARVLDERLTLEMLREEAVMLGLRTVDGIDLGAFERRFGERLERSESARRLMAAGHVVVLDGRLMVARGSFFLSDAVALDLLGAPVGRSL